MAITQISAKDFRSHAKLNLLTDEFNMFVGPMGAGKSSILHLVCVLLAGQDPLVNAKGEGLRREIRRGCEEFIGALKLTDGTIIERKVSAGPQRVSINGTFKDVKLQQGRICERLSCEPELILVLLDPRPFFSFDEKVQRKILLVLMSSNKIDAPQSCKNLGMESFSGVGAMDETIKRLKEEDVRDLNREIKGLHARIAPPVEFDASAKPKLEALVSELKPQRESAIRKQAAETEWNRTLDALKAKIQEAEKGGSLMDAATALGKSKGELEEAQKTLTDLRTAYQQANNELQAKAKEIVAVEAELGSRDKILAKVGTMGEQCGVVDKFKCPLPQSDKGKMMKELSNENVAAGKRLRALKAEHEKLTQRKAEQEKKGSEQSQAVESLTSEVSSLELRVATLRQTREQLTAHEAARPETGDWPKELAAVSEKLNSAQIGLQDINQKSEEAARRAVQVAEVTAKEAKVEELSRAVQDLEDVKTKLLQESSGGFLTELKAFMSRFGFNEVEYSSEPFGFVVNGRFFDQLSGGQKVIMDAALRVAAAKQSGLQMLAVDDMNKVGEKMRQHLAHALGESGCQVFTCTTTEVKPQAPEGRKFSNNPDQPGVKVWWLSQENPDAPSKVEVL